MKFTFNLVIHRRYVYIINLHQWTKYGAGLLKPSVYENAKVLTST